MDKELHVLIVEDSAADAELITKELGKGGLVHTSKIVKSKDEFLKALGEYTPDIILCDYVMSGFGAPEALEIAKEISLKTPFVVVSGAIGEDTAVEMLKSGAADYVMKDNIFRLPMVVTRALKENEERVVRKSAEEALRKKEERFRAIFNTTFQFTGLMTLDGTLIEANQSAVDFTGLKLEDVINRPFWETHWWRGNEERVKKLKESIRLAASGKFIRYEVELQGSGDTTAIFDFSIKPAFGPDGKVAMLVPEGRDITERKKMEEEARKRLQELEVFYKASVGREERILELKKEIEQLKKRAGKIAL